MTGIRTIIRALLNRKLTRHDRLQEILSAFGIDGLASLLQPSIEKYGMTYALDRFRLPLIETQALLEGKTFTPPVVILCGARTRTGAPCTRKAVEGKQRCGSHGGLNRSDRTPQGRINAGKGLRQWHEARRKAKQTPQNAP